MKNKRKKPGKNIILGICAGISSYKSAVLARSLIKSGFSVKVVMTEAAVKFVTPLVFQTLTKNYVYTEMFSSYEEGEFLKHVSLADWADLCVIAPLSANTLSKIACGICDNLLTTLICALPRETKVLCVPAMNKYMWKSSIIRKNAAILKKVGNFTFIDPEIGELASGDYGEGRMAEPKDILKRIKALL